MKLLLLGDTHLGIYQSSELYHDIVYKLFEEIKDYCISNNINTILHLGDFFHERKVLNTKTQWVAHQIANLFQSSDISFHIIVGNHDCYYKNSIEPTALDIFKNYENIYVWKETTELFDGELQVVPWGQLPIRQEGYVFGHFEFSGFKMNSNYICEHGLDPTDWKKFKQIYSGHFHWPSSKGNITYLGSAYPQTFHDIDSPRGYYIWDDGDLEFIEYKNCPKFIKIETSNINNNKIKNNIVKLVFTEDYGSIKNQKIIDDVISFNPTKIQVDFSQVKIEGTEDTLETMDASLLDHQEILQEYIKKTDLPSFVKKKTLLTMIEKLKDEN